MREFYMKFSNCWAEYLRSKQIGRHSSVFQRKQDKPLSIYYVDSTFHFFYCRHSIFYLYHNMNEINV